MSVDAIMSVEDGSEIQPGDVLARIFERSKTKDTRVVCLELLSCLKLKMKDHAIAAELDGYAFWKRELCDSDGKEDEAVEYTVEEASV